MKCKNTISLEIKRDFETVFIINEKYKNHKLEYLTER